MGLPLIIRLQENLLHNIFSNISKKSCYILVFKILFLFLEKEQHKKQTKLHALSTYNPPRPLKLPTGLNKPSQTKKKLIPPGSTSYDFARRNSPTLGNLSKEAYDRLKQYPQHRRMGPTTSALVRPAPPFSRPPPGAALRVMPPKKRVKLEDDDESDSDAKNDTKKLQNKRSDYKVCFKSIYF